MNAPTIPVPTPSVSAPSVRADPSIPQDRVASPSKPALAAGGPFDTSGRTGDPVVLDADSLTKHYPVSQGFMKPKALARALDGVSFTLRSGKTLAGVGEWGGGKRPRARQITMSETPPSGQLRLTGIDVAPADAATKKQLRQQVQM